jgi:tRNA(Ile)-lysidine synthase
MPASHTSQEDLAARVQRALLNDCQLDPSKPLVAGVSGGPDSLSLLSLLSRLGWQVYAAHFDHHLRPESGAEAVWVAEKARKMGVPFLGGGAQVSELARAQRLSVEEAARQARYSFLFDCARQVSAQAVTVGHTASDQVETVLMHLLRGAGLSGLKGMAPLSLQEGWDRQIPLARPLLMIWREEIEQFCIENGLEPLQDASNADMAFFRNRLRHELIPILESYNPRFRPALLRTAEVLAGDWEFMESALDAAFSTLCKAQGAGYAVFDLAALRGLVPSLLRGLLRRACASLRPGLRDIDFDDIERAAKFIWQPTLTLKMNWVSGLRLFIEDDLLYLEEPGKAPLPAHWPQLAHTQIEYLEVPGQIELASGLILEAEWFQAAPADFWMCAADETWIDGANLELPLIVRSSQAGERFDPLGMAGRSQKLSDLWINAKIPHRARKLWPLVCSGERIAWLAGLRSSHAFQVGSASTEVVRLRLIRPGAG